MKLWKAKRYFANLLCVERPSWSDVSLTFDNWLRQRCGKKRSRAVAAHVIFVRNFIDYKRVKRHYLRGLILSHRNRHLGSNLNISEKIMF